MVFDYYEGANFKLCIRMVKMDTDKKAMPNYDKSEFKMPSPLFDGDDNEIDKIKEKTLPIAEFIDHKNYKSYEELTIKFHEVCGIEKSESEQIQVKESKPTVETKPILPKVEKTPDLNIVDDSEADFLSKLQSDEI
jgi:hypothetical protein